MFIKTAYFNEGDLSFWRSISMVRDKRPGYEGDIAFTTGNYATEAAALAGKPTVSIVNMEYSPGPEGDRIAVDGTGGVVNFGDQAIFKGLFGSPPGPSCFDNAGGCVP